MSAGFEVTPQAIQAAQGTRLQEKAPWETYDESLEIDMTPELEAAVAAYESNRYESTSSQNQEELAWRKELSDEAAKEYQWCTKEEYRDIQMRMGTIIHSSELINRLRKIGVKCWYRDHPHADKITLLVQTQEAAPPEVGCWVQNGYMPEYTVMGFDDHGVPLAEKYRGWRTVLLQLIIKGVLKEETAHKEFGIADKPCADRYNSILHGFRNTFKE
jgi:hypothetical protein